MEKKTGIREGSQGVGLLGKEQWGMSGLNWDARWNAVCLDKTHEYYYFE